MNTKEIIAGDKKYIGQTYARFPMAVAKGKGSWVWDAEGRKYLDLFSGLAVNALGHGNPEVVAAIKAQLALFNHSGNLYYSEPQVKLAGMLAAASFADRVFFANTGAEAVELCIKLARRHGLKRGRNQIVAMQNSFHGRTYGALSATGQAKYHRGFEPMLPGFVHVPFDDLAAAARAVTSKTCAILVEPVQGEGGVRLPSKGYLLGLQALCRRHGLLLILDEIQTGMGRTGSLFYYQQVKGLKPDLMTLAKSLGGGLPLSAVLATQKAASLVGPGDHGTTMGGNALACAAGAASLKVVLSQELPQRAARMGARLKKELEALQKDFPAIREVRVAGMMAGLELSVEAGPLAKAALSQGLLVNATAGNVLRLLPPLTLSESELSSGMSMLRKVFQSQL